MKIVYCIPSLQNPGGMERVLTEKVNFLSRNYGYDIAIITTEGSNKPYFLLDKKISIVNFNINFNSFFSAPLISKIILHNRRLCLYKTLLYNYLKDNSVDICVSLCGKEIDFLADLKDGSKKVAELHFARNFRKQFLLARKHGKFWELLGNIRTWQLKKATQKLDAFVVLTKADLRKWQVSHSNVYQIYNPCIYSGEILTSSLEKQKFLAIGKLDAQKGFDYLISAWKLVATKYPNWTLCIFGQGEWKEKLSNMIRTFHLENSVLLLGLTNDVKFEYLNSSGYIMSSRYEGFPMVLLEAMSFGLPIVSFDCESGPNEIIDNGVNGFLVPSGDTDSLARYILLLIEDITLRKKMGMMGKNKSMLFDMESIMEQWNNLFLSLRYNR